jgi:hypothetical protein
MIKDDAVQVHLSMVNDPDECDWSIMAPLARALAWYIEDYTLCLPFLRRSSALTYANIVSKSVGTSGAPLVLGDSLQHLRKLRINGFAIFMLLPVQSNLELLDINALDKLSLSCKDLDSFLESNVSFQLTYKYIEGRFFVDLLSAMGKRRVAFLTENQPGGCIRIQHRAESADAQIFKFAKRCVCGACDCCLIEAGLARESSDDCELEPPQG